MENLYGLFLSPYLWEWSAVLILIFLFMGYRGVSFFYWALFFIAVHIGMKAAPWHLASVIIFCSIYLITPLRRMLSKFLMKRMQAFGFIPKVSDTERAALDAGTVWIERDIFSGAPNFKKLMHKTYPILTDEEKQFLDGPVETLCQMCDDWKITKERKIPENVWDYLKKEKFLGMIIPKKYGGLEFSAYAHSEVIMKLSSRSIPVAISVMVPNSLGPAELLIHYGTEEQKEHYLPRLAIGEDIPCFALTEPGAGSDAGSIDANGVLFKGEDGRFYIRLNWNKRWITLAGMASVVGLAFRLKDPEHFLGQGDDIGITCALIPGDTEGVFREHRHDPMGIPFLNCPTQGKNVVILAEKGIIGGLVNAGHGWKMLMECLAAGRGISLPALATSASKMTSRIVGAHSGVRKQFGTSIAHFEGVSEALARIAGKTYLVDSLRTLTVSSLNQGGKPPVITAITKYYATEISREAVKDGMDILGGAGLSLGPRNLLAAHYISAPIAITVEGANILTRTLIIFGQGLFRAHPYAYPLIRSLEASDAKLFDRSFWGHIGHVCTCMFRAPLLSLTRGRLYGKAPKKNRRYFQKLAWSSASFALTTNIAMILVGPALKFKESLSGRFADILAWNYIGFAVLYRFAAQNSPKEDQVLVDWSMKYVFDQLQKSFDGIYANLDVPVLGWFFKIVLGSWARLNRFDNLSSDHLNFKLADIITHASPSRDRLTQGIYIPRDHRKESLARLEYALRLSEMETKIEHVIKDAVKKKLLPKAHMDELAEQACQLKIISDDDLKTLKLAKEVRWNAIQVDEFTEEEYRTHDWNRNHLREVS